MTTTDWAASVAAVLLLAVAAFQAALVAGAPWRHVTYGGRAGESAGVLPGSFRAMSAAAVVVLACSAWIVLARAELVAHGPFSAGLVAAAVWFIFGYLVLNTVMNLLSSSRVERLGFGAVTLLAAIGCLIVAL